MTTKTRFRPVVVERGYVPLADTAPRFCRDLEAVEMCREALDIRSLTTDEMVAEMDAMSETFNAGMQRRGLGHVQLARHTAREIALREPWPGAALFAFLSIEGLADTDPKSLPAVLRDWKPTTDEGRVLGILLTFAGHPAGQDGMAFRTYSKWKWDHSLRNTLLGRQMKQEAISRDLLVQNIQHDRKAFARNKERWAGELAKAMACPDLPQDSTLPTRCGKP